MTDQQSMEANVIHDAGQTKFMRRMRFHQSWYRKYRLGRHAGTNPYAKNQTALYGSRLRDRAARSGKNFITREIFRAAKERLAEDRGIVNDKDKSRLLYDMLSSQPMCFNLFGQLVHNHRLATRLIRLLPGVAPDIDVTRVALEYAPDKKLHLNDATSHDAFVEYRLPDGQLGFIGIETKLTEPFSRSSYECSDRYRRWILKPGSWWNDNVELHFEDPTFNQLWRNHLLSFAMLHQVPPRYSQAQAAVLYHDADTSCPDAMNAYRGHLTTRAQDTLLDWPLSVILSLWQQALKGPEERSWLKEFHLRYWELEASQLAWDSFQQAKNKPKTK